MVSVLVSVGVNAPAQSLIFVNSDNDLTDGTGLEQVCDAVKMFIIETVLTFIEQGYGDITHEQALIGSKSEIDQRTRLKYQRISDKHQRKISHSLPFSLAVIEPSGCI